MSLRLHYNRLIRTSRSHIGELLLFLILFEGRSYYHLIVTIRDWTVDAPSADPKASVLFTADYYGTSAGKEDYFIVNSSKLAFFPINNDPLNISGIWWESPAGYLRGPLNYNPAPNLTRNVGSFGTYLPTSEQFNECLYMNNYSYHMSCIW